jgi:serine/threonine-protein kinase RsbW
MSRSVDVRIRNELSDIAIIRDTLDNLGEELGVPLGVLTPLQIALDEVVSNVVKYAWDDSAAHEILVRMTVLPDRIDLEVFDNGREFDPAAVSHPKTTPEGKRPRPGGLGIHLVRNLVDKFEYERIDGRNHTTLSKACKVGAQSQGSGE